VLNPGIFIILQAVILVDFICVIAEGWITAFQDGGPKKAFYQFLLIGSTFLLYSFTITVTALLYRYYTKPELPECKLNTVHHLDFSSL
jgi:serine incorporator 1/3